jgi:uncharacterized membrane protein
MSDTVTANGKPTKAELARTAGLVGILGGAGVMHFVNPEFFDPIVPRWMPGSARAVTYASGVVELASAALVINPRTRRAGALFAFLTFLGVWPANIQAALDGGMKDLDPPMDSAAVAWIRVPFQLPMMWLAFKLAKDVKARTA